MKRKVILTCAVSGNAPVGPKYPYRYPHTPAEIAEDIVEVARLGAAVCHVHARDEATRSGSSDPQLFDEIVRLVRASGTDVCLNLTTGAGAVLLPDPDDNLRPLPGTDIQTVEQRMAHVRSGRPELASFNVTTANQAEGKFEYVYLNPQENLRRMAAAFLDCGTKPEIECYNPGDVLFARDLIERGLIASPPLFQFVMGIKWGTPADSLSLLQMKALLPPDALWTAFGIGPMQMPMVARAVLEGGHVRVGLEDNHYLDRGVFARNADLVTRARTIIEHLGCELATPAEAREMLAIG